MLAGNYANGTFHQRSHYVITQWRRPAHVVPSKAQVFGIIFEKEPTQNQGII
jgi:hypothetical protein